MVICLDAFIWAEHYFKSISKSETQTALSGTKKQQQLDPFGIKTLNWDYSLGGSN